jgi:hypothetical protein
VGIGKTFLTLYRLNVSNRFERAMPEAREADPLITVAFTATDHPTPSTPTSIDQAMDVISTMNRIGY